MHPAPSVILFTVLSGLGFGLLAWLGLGYPPATGWNAFVFYLLAFGLILAGLLASAFHLGRPQNALRAFSQWRSSWLSREAWLTALALAVMGICALLAIFFATRARGLGALGAALSLAAVFATSMIYAQLKTVPRWNHWTTPALFLLLALSGGALLAGQLWFAVPGLALSGAVQLLAWGLGDSRFARRGHSLETATGLGEIGHVRPLEPPHTSPNYLMKEMIFQVGRKHARRLRAIAFTLMSVLPVGGLLLFPANWAGLGLALISHLAGALTARWLFFAEARHVVGLYYGAPLCQSAGPKV